MPRENFTQLPTTTSANLTDIIAAVQNPDVPANADTVQMTLQQVINLANAQNVLFNSGNPNGSVAGVLHQLCYDTTNLFLWVCTTTGSTTTAVWKTTVGVLTNGQLIIGSTGLSPVASTLTAGTNMGITNAPGSVTLNSSVTPTFTSCTLGIASATSLNFGASATSGILGVTGASVAGSGVVGEVISSTVVSGSAVALTTATDANVTSIALTAGDWDVTGQVAFLLDAATVPTSYAVGINTVSATVPAFSSINASGQTLSATFGTGSSACLNAGTCRINVNTTTTIYLVASSVFSINTMGAYGAIYARRIR